MLWALCQQALEGQCNQPKPWSWNVVDAAKWQSWNQVGALPPADDPRDPARARRQPLANSPPNPALATQLGNMDAAEAMRLYVRTVEEDAGPDWLAELSDDAIAKAREEAAALPASTSTNASTSGAWPVPQTASDGWQAVATTGGEPAPRCDVACTLAGAASARQLFIFGGARSSRRANDAHALNLSTGKWSVAAARPAPPADGALPTGPPPVAGARLIPLGAYVYALGGRVRGAAAPSTLEVWRVRVTPMPSSDGAGKLAAWERVPCGGDAPVARHGHCANLVAFGGGARIIVFGGESALPTDSKNGEPTRRTVLSDVCVLDVSKLHGAGGGATADERGSPLAEWSSPPCGGAAPPPPLANAASAAIGARFVAYFGGGGAVGSNVSPALHILDAATMTWLDVEQSTPREVRLLYAPSERAGHAAVSANGGRDLVILGGGDGKRSLDDVWVVFGMREALLECVAGGHGYRPAWTYLMECRGDAVAREGFGCAYDDASGLCFVFGGYDGTYRNDVAALKVPAEAPDPPKGGEDGTAAPTKAVEMVAVPTGDGTAMHMVEKEREEEAPPPADTTPASRAAAPAPAPAPPQASPARPAEAMPAASPPSPAGNARALAEARAAQDTASKEVALMRKQLQTAQSALASEESAHAATKEALDEARGQVMRMEVEIAEMREALDKAKGIEKEATLLRKRVEEEAESQQGGGGGLWSFISGGDVAKA